MIILLSGAINSGKDTVAEFLKKNHGYHVVKFAQRLKEEAARNSNIPLDHFEDREEKERARECEAFGIKASLSPRDLAILTGMIAKIGNLHVWADSLIEEINSHEKVVISDWRFPKELTRVAHNHPGRAVIPLEIVRPGTGHIKNGAEGRLTKTPKSYIIDNIGTLEDLEKETAYVSQCVEEWSRGDNHVSVSVDG